MELFSRVFGQGKPLVVLHGLYGCSDNWISIAKGLSEFNEVHLLDLRNHGKSPHHNLHNYEVMKADIFEYLQKTGKKKASFLGHSMGGKAVMNFSVDFSQMIDKMIVVDISPRDYNKEKEFSKNIKLHELIIGGLNQIGIENIRSITEADEQLQQFLPDLRLRQFLLKNLKRTSEGYEWKFNLPAITKNIYEVMKGIEGPKEKIKLNPLFIRGKMSNYIQEKDIAFINDIYESSMIEVIPNTGHWVHAEAPEEFLSIVTEYLNY